nr:somatostatin receptor type 5-like [Biomphalaria glabrata]
MLANITISTLAIIAVIRFVNIEVFDRVRNLKGYIIALIVVWLLQCGVSVPNGIWNTVLATTKTCSIPFENLNRTKEYTLIVRVLCFFVPLVVMWLSNVGVVIKMRASSLKVQPFSAHINYAMQRHRRHRRVTLTCLFLALVFTINLTPFEASLIVIHVDSGLTKQLSLNVLEYLWLLTVLNTCVNPFIYGFCFKDLRQRLVRILESIMPRATNKSSTNNRDPITDKTRRNLPRQDSIRIDVNQRSPSSDHTIRNQLHVHVITSTCPNVQDTSSLNWMKPKYKATK